MEIAEINKIREQFHGGQWPKFLDAVTITNLRGWTGQTVRFQFPVSVVVGQNGSGKSTVLKSAACAYVNENISKTYYPSDFFINTQWEPIGEAVLRFSIRQGAGAPVEFEIKKNPERWRGPKTRPQRHVFYNDISRTLPLDAVAGYARLAKTVGDEISAKHLEEEYRNGLSHVLSRQYTAARFSTSDSDPKRPVGLVSRGALEISQYHQGAGEDATLDLFSSMQEIPNTSLLIIDEVEASLHPSAQRRLVRFLLTLARKKKIQVILSSHSPYVLQELPAEARCMLLPTAAGGMDPVYGVTPELAMSRLDDEKHAELNVFVEDKQAGRLVREIVAAAPEGSDTISRIEILEVGPSNVVKTLGSLGHDGKLPYPSLAVLDADEQATAGCVVLPGEHAPEIQVYGDLKAANWPNLQNRFGIGAGDLHAYLEDAMLAPDHHTWNSRVGDRVLKSRDSVWEVLVSEWVRVCLSPESRDTFAEKVRELLH